MTNAPLVSIGMPVFNRVEFLPMCFKHLLAQDYSNIEVCVSDNASTDGSRNICLRFAREDRRIRLNCNDENRGIIANFRTVLDMACGKYFMWAGSDDNWDPNFVSHLVHELENHPRAVGAMCATERINQDGRVLDQIRYDKDANPNDMTPLDQARSLMTASTVQRNKKQNLILCGLFRRDILSRVLSDCPAESFASDRHLLCVLALAGGFRYVDQLLFTKTLHRKPFSQRNPNDDFVRRKKGGAFFANMWMVSQWIARSRMVPWHRKLYIPLIIGPKFLRRAFENVVNAVAAALPQTVKTIVRRGLATLRTVTNREPQ